MKPWDLVFRDLLSFGQPLHLGDNFVVFHGDFKILRRDAADVGAAVSQEWLDSFLVSEATKNEQDKWSTNQGAVLLEANTHHPKSFWAIKEAVRQLRKLYRNNMTLYSLNRKQTEALVTHLAWSVGGGARTRGTRVVVR